MYTHCTNLTYNEQDFVRLCKTSLPPIGTVRKPISSSAAIFLQGKFVIFYIARILSFCRLHLFLVYHRRIHLKSTPRADAETSANIIIKGIRCHLFLNINTNCLIQKTVDRNRSEGYIRLGDNSVANYVLEDRLRRNVQGVYALCVPLPAPNIFMTKIIFSQVFR